MTIIGIDLGTTTGWALLGNQGNRLDSGYWTLPSGERKPAHARFWALNDKLGALLVTAWRLGKEEKIHVAYERPTFFGHLAPALVFGGFEAVLLIRAAASEAEYHPIPVPHVKLAAIGRGRVKAVPGVKRDPKAGMTEAALARWPLPQNHPEWTYQSDEVDALWTAEACRLAIQGGTLPWDNVPPTADETRRPRAPRKAKTKPELAMGPMI